MKFVHLLVILWAVLSETYSLSSLKEIRGRKGGSVWIPCYYDVKYRNNVKFFFQKRTFGRRIFLTQTTGADDRITISDDKSQGMFAITMKNLKKRDEGYYYCGLKREKWNEEVYLYLSVDEGDYLLSISSDSNVFTGQDMGSVSVSCKYTHTKYVSFIKYWCRGKDFDSCRKLIRSDSPRLYNNRVSIRDDTASQELTVTMTSLQRTDSDWYWCAIETGYRHERVPVYIRVTQAPETGEQQIATSLSSLQTLVTNVLNVTTSKNQTEHCSEVPGTHSVLEDSRGHLIIVLVTGALLLLFLTAGIFTLKMKRNRKGEHQNEKKDLCPEGEGRIEEKSRDVIYATVSLQKKRTKNKVTEPPSEDMQYAVISFERKTKEDRKPSRDPEDSITYSAVGFKQTS